MNPKHKELAEKVIDFFKKSEKPRLIPGRDLLHLLPDSNTAEKVIYSLEKDFGLIERSGKEAFRLTKKGWEFISFEKLEKDSTRTPLTLYQKIHIGLTITSLISVIVLGYLNYSLSNDKYYLKNNNNRLHYNISRYKDSLNKYKEKELSKKLTTENNPSQIKNLTD